VTSIPQVDENSTVLVKVEMISRLVEHANRSWSVLGQECDPYWIVLLYLQYTKENRHANGCGRGGGRSW